MGNYRFDNRSKKQFADDIKNSTRKEKELLNCWLDYLEKRNNKRPGFKYAGCGSDKGEYLDIKNVSTDADYEVDGYGLIEVKFSKKKLNKVFHLKINQVKSYINQGATILMVDGADTKSPYFTLIDADTLKIIQDDCKIKAWAGFGYKQSYVVPLNMFVWRKLI